MQIGIQWPLVLFTLFAGAGCGLLAITGLVQLASKQDKKTIKTALIIALVLLGLGGLMSVMHLAHPERFMAAITNLLSFSGISLELIGLALSGAAALLFLAFASAENRLGIKIIAACSLIIGVVASFLHGYAYFEVVSQLGWHTIALPLSYLLTSLTAGVLIYCTLISRKTDDVADFGLVKKAALVTAALATLAIIAYVAFLGTAELLQNEALVCAALAIVFELLALGSSAFFFLKKSSTPVIVIAALLGIAGGLSVRVLMWLVSTYGLSLIWQAVVNQGLYPF